MAYPRPADLVTQSVSWDTRQLLIALRRQEVLLESILKALETYEGERVSK